jgi:hypothetical protein
VSSVSFVSTTNTARSLAFSVLLALALTPWRSPGSSEKLSPALVGCDRSVVDLTADRPLKHGRVDEGGFGMRVTRRVAVRAVFDEHALDALAGDVWQFVPSHLNRAISNGVTETELAAAITHLAFYAGFPVASSASAVANCTYCCSRPRSLLTSSGWTADAAFPHVLRT